MSYTNMPQAPIDPRAAKALAKATKAYAKTLRPFYKKKRFIIPIAGAVLVVGIAASSGGSSTTTSSTSTGTSQVATAILPGIGAVQTSGKMQVTLISWKNVGKTYGPTGMTDTAQGTFWAASVTIKNTGVSKFTFDNSGDTAYTAAGVKYDALTTTSDADSWLTPINPGNSITTRVVFDVAPGVTISKLGFNEPFSLTSDEVFFKVS